MKTLYIECAMGAAGDMLTAALLELMPDKEAALAKLNAMGIPGVVFEAEPSAKCGITGTHMRVLIHGEEEESVPCGHTHAHEDHHEYNHAHEHHHEHEHMHEVAHCHGSKDHMYRNICTSMRIPMAMIPHIVTSIYTRAMTDFLSTITTTNTTTIILRMRITMRIMAWQRFAV